MSTLVRILRPFLNPVTAPVVTAIVFWAVITPLAMILRWTGKAPLDLAFDRRAESYWLTRHDMPGSRSGGGAP